MVDLPTPLRIPDEWEVKNLIHPDLARRVRAQGHSANTRAIKELEREMAARWESLNPKLVLLATSSPEMRKRLHRDVGAPSGRLRLLAICGDGAGDNATT